MPDIIKTLTAGYQRFRERYFSEDKKCFFEDLVKEGQSPEIMIVACSDSRVDPSIILDSAPGELFVVRNVANLIPPCEKNTGYHGTSAALEFAVKILKVKHIIVLGHSHCGGIHALLHNDANEKNIEKHSGFIQSWMSIAHETKHHIQDTFKHKTPEEQERLCEEQSLITSLKNLRTFPWIEKKISRQELFLHAWYFDLEAGVLETFNADNKKFEVLK